MKIWLKGLCNTLFLVLDCFKSAKATVEDHKDNNLWGFEGISVTFISFVKLYPFQ